MYTCTGTLQKGQGSGLGLSFCKQIVNFHGGTISVTSKEGKGSRFEFKIPFPIATPSACPFHMESTYIQPYTSLNNKSSERQPYMAVANKVRKSEVDIEARAPVLAPQVQVPDMSALKVLVVDDADSNRKMLMMLVKKMGFTAKSTEDGQQTVNVILADMERYQLILMDNLMPVMNGSDAAKVLRRAGYPYLIIGITGNVMNDDLAEFLASGADMVIAKPFKKQTLNILLEFVEKNGTLSRPHQTLVQKGGEICWH